MESFYNIYNFLTAQKVDGVEILFDNSSRNEKSIGKKRNELLSIAQGKYVAFVDDDDMVSTDYVQTILEGCKSDKDCVSLRGVITFNGTNPEVFEHSLKYKEWKTTGNHIKYERYPNHLNAIKTSIAQQFKFPEINHGEDHDWSTQIHMSGLIKTEHYVDKVLYHYQFKPNK